MTGATGGLGSAMSRRLLAEGAKVALLARGEERARALLRALTGEGFADVAIVRADVVDRAALEAARDAVLARWGRVDVLVNAAGGNDPRGGSRLERLDPDAELEDSFFGLDPAGVEAVYRLNFLGTLLPTQAFARAMAERGGGSVINVSSVAASQPLTRVAAYAAAKASVENFTRWLAVHLAPRAVRVNALVPGFFLTEQNRFLLLEADGRTLTPRGGRALAKTPLGRFGEPADLGGALSFLASDDSAFVTGTLLPVDGGFLASSGV